jgi:antitoxin YefM
MARRSFSHVYFVFNITEDAGNLQPRQIALQPSKQPRNERVRNLDTAAVAIILAVIEVIMNEISKYVPITKAKNDLLELIRQVENVDESVAITKNGVPAAVILSMEKYAGLLETLEILSDEETVKALRTSVRQARKGKWLRTDQVFRR